MYNVALLSVMLVLLKLKSCCTQVLQFGECSDVSTMKYFDLEKFLGKWYEIERFPTWYEENGNCAYKFINQCGRRIEIEHGFVRDEIQYILHINSSYVPGDDAVFKIKKNNIDTIGIPLSVITTDYSNYAIVYGCKSSTLLGIHVKYTWILSRVSTLSTEILEKAHQELNAIPGAHEIYLEAVQQSEDTCRYSWTAHVDAEIVDGGDDDDEDKDDYDD